ncbi:MAG: nucleotidyltransferase domain-containing protein [Clostridia bacterium]|nr:nucleotidyltransferase domain-containing protein [Clostridia bacterium]
MARPYTIDQIKARLTPVFVRNNVRRAVLFGSYGKGLATPDSDIDILVDSGLPGLSFFGLMEDVCRSFDCPVDLIDTRDIVPGSRIEREIQKTGKIIYER